MSKIELVEGDFLKWLRDHQWLAQNGMLPKAQACFFDPPYYLGSIGKRFGGANAAPAKFGRDGAFARSSRGFLGKTWDGFDDVWAYQDWATEWSSLLLDFVYPGGLLACFGASRTFAHLICGLEAAGWEVFDVIMMVYSTGFPKSTSLSKLIDQHLGVERDVIGQGTTSRAANQEDSYDITANTSDEAKQWDGYKGLLKPAYEPVILARAPRSGLSFAELALKFGSGSMNIDGSRIPTDDELIHGGNLIASLADGRSGAALGMLANGTGNTFVQNPAGRYPANLMLECHCPSDSHDADCPVRILDQQSGERKAGGDRSGLEPSSKTKLVYGHYDHNDPWQSYDDSGGAARFLHTIKPGEFEKEAGLETFTPVAVGDGRGKSIDNPFQRGETLRKNIHPTLKSIKFCEWIARLLLPPPLSMPRRILTPFAGSGSEMIGAHLAGWDEVVGFEREADYCAINRARTKWWSDFSSYDEARSAYEGEQARQQQADRGQLSLF